MNGGEVFDEPALEDDDSSGRRSDDKAETPAFVNHHFRDVAETGSWGKVSSKEIFVLLVLALFLIAGVSVASVYLLAKMNNSNNNVEILPPPVFPEFDDMYHSDEALYYGLIGQIQGATTHADVVLANFPQSYSDLYAANDIDSYTKAANWLVNIDVSRDKLESSVLVRFALAVTFYSMNGDDWFNKTGWLSPNHICSWYGVACDNFRLQGIILDENNLSGTLHHAWESLDSCQALLLRDNNIMGSIPGASLGRMKKLRIIQLQQNMISGTIPAELREAATLDTLFVNGNPSLTGSWPQVFCPTQHGRPVFSEFGLNCDLIQCSCCDEEKNCFQD